MGALTLPDSGPIYLDSCGFIYSVERVEPYRTLLEPMWRQAAAGKFVIVTSELTVLETAGQAPQGRAMRSSKDSSGNYLMRSKYD